MVNINPILTTRKVRFVKLSEHSGELTFLRQLSGFLLEVEIGNL